MGLKPSQKYRNWVIIVGNRNRHQIYDLLEDRIGYRLGHMVNLLSYHIEDATYALFDDDRTQSAESRAFDVKILYW